MDRLPYIYLAPDAPEIPVVVSVPHSGTRIPAEDTATIDVDDTVRLMDTDLAVDRLVMGVPLLGAHLLASTVSRYVVDLNRDPADIDPQLCPGAAGKPNPRSLIWRLTTAGVPVHNRPLTRAEVDDRIQRVHRPYHRRLTELLAEVRARHGFAILLDAHSRPSRGRATHADPGRERADVVPGNVQGQSGTPRMTARVEAHFREAGLTVALNDPYQGGWITQHHGRPSEGIHAIQVVVNRRLYHYEDAPGWDGRKAPRIQRILEGLVRSLGSFQPGD